MSKYAGEEVLVVTRPLLEELATFQGMRVDGVDDIVSVLLTDDNHFFMDRGAAEEDPSHKQLIPYCIFKCGDRVLYYTRGKAGGENRLHSKISVGVGGHINPVDMIQGDYEMRVVGLLNDDSNPVGQVHLGVVHLVELENEQVSSREDALTDLSWATLSELKRELFERLETWSQLCVEHLAEG